MVGSFAPDTPEEARLSALRSESLFTRGGADASARAPTPAHVHDDETPARVRGTRAGEGVDALLRAFQASRCAAFRGTYVLEKIPRHPSSIERGMNPHESILTRV